MFNCPIRISIFDINILRSDANLFVVDNPIFSFNINLEPSSSGSSVLTLASPNLIFGVVAHGLWQGPES
jgi:hypothetical protein